MNNHKNGKYDYEFIYRKEFCYMLLKVIVLVVGQFLFLGQKEAVCGFKRTKYINVI